MLNGGSRDQTRATQAVEVRPDRGDAGRGILRVVAEPVVAETIDAQRGERAARAPPLPPRRGLGIHHERPAPLRPRARVDAQRRAARLGPLDEAERAVATVMERPPQATGRRVVEVWIRSEEHTSELQSQSNLVCRLLLEKKKKKRSKLRSVYTLSIFADRI